VMSSNPTNTFIAAFKSKLRTVPKHKLVTVFLFGSLFSSGIGYYKYRFSDDHRLDFIEAELAEMRARTRLQQQQQLESARQAK
ncbi:hypothetical protein BOX15_Mlig032078g1, partial [Macrostomum lignano]